MTATSDPHPPPTDESCDVVGHDWLSPHEAGIVIDGEWRLLAVHRCCARCLWEERVPDDVLARHLATVDRSTLGR